MIPELVTGRLSPDAKLVQSGRRYAMRYEIYFDAHPKMKSGRPLAPEIPYALVVYSPYESNDPPYRGFEAEQIAWRATVPEAIEYANQYYAKHHDYYEDTMQENPLSDHAKKMLMVAGVGLASGIGLVLVWHRRANASQAVASPSTPTAPLGSKMPELPVSMPPPYEVLTLTDNGKSITLPANSRIDVVLPDLSNAKMDWAFSYTGDPPASGGSAAGPFGGFEMRLADSTQSEYAAVAQGGPLLIKSFQVSGSSGGTINARYDLKDASFTTQSTLQFTLAIQ